MKRVLGDFEAVIFDDRGSIEDLLVEPLDSVTKIWTRKGGVRGNHVHNETTQWTYVISGVLRMTDGKSEISVGPREMVVHEPGVPHAWKAEENAQCLVFTRGPRSGDNYESDTYRLEEPLFP